MSRWYENVRTSMRSTWALRLVRHWTMIAAVVAVALWAVAISEAHFVDMGSNGLVTILRWPYFASLVVVCGAFVAEVFRRESADWRLTVLVLTIVLILFGTAPAIEPVAAITESWIHTGFISYILTHGHVLHGYDARFSWPGGFVLASLFSAFTGQANSLAFTRWFPLFIEAMYLAPVLVIGANAGVSRRTKWLGVAIFYAADWIYQDYFSPQALDYFFYLVVIASVLAIWSPTRRSFVRGRGLVGTKIDQVRNALRWSRLIGEQTVTRQSSSTIYFVMGLCSVIILAAVMSHQLTPYALILALMACLVTSRLGRPELLALAAVFSIGWLSLGASDFWIGHLSVIFGGVGQVGSTIDSNVAARVVGSASHRFMVSSRIEFTGLVLLLAGVGFLRRASDSRTLEALAGAPFLILALQGYGGEGLLRVVLFSLPFVSLLAASALIPTLTGEIRPWIPPMKWMNPMETLRPVVVFVVLVSMCVVTSIVRGGNDAYESYSVGELNAVNYVYDHVKVNQVVGVISTYLPIGQRDVGSLDVISFGGDNIPTLKDMSKSLLRIRPDYVILSTSQENWGEVVGGYPPGWENDVGAKLLAAGYRVVAYWSTAQVYEAFNQWGPLPGG
jgi:hypothetical protein